MSTKRPDVADIYAGAPAGEDPERLEAYLREVCGDDESLRARVERLLEARANRGSFLDSQAIDRTALYDKPTEHAIGSSIGPYSLLEEIGEGGMGVVYLAEQTHPVRRRVALKVIKPGMDTRQVIARFNAERQALALMDHTNICRVIDAGTTEAGRPYFVMELVRGVAITEYCDRERLTIRQRLELFVQVCRAVQHAHQKGIIHRDIKPSNILVTVIDGVAIPKIIDFGVAKATGPSLAEGSLLTGFQQFIGTPLYMSPEQADFSGVDVDTRSDIYSLGVLLYELLTGTTPILEETFRAAGVGSLRELICETEPPPPSSRLSTLSDEMLSTASANRRAEPRPLSLSMRGELDWIVMKALEKDRQRRYETASALSDDVVRHLNDEPVEACPPSRRYQLTKFARRHRATIATATTLLLAITVALGVSLWQTAKATRAAERAQLADETKGAALAQARQAVDQMYTKVAEKWLDEQGELTAVQRELLEDALVFYEGFATQSDPDPDVQYEALRARLRVADIRKQLGDRQGAQRSYVEAVDEASRLAQLYPSEARFRIDLVTARVSLANMIREIGNHDDADVLVRLCVKEAEALGESEIADLLDRERLAVALGGLSGQLTQAGRLEEAERIIDKSLVLWKSLLAMDAANPDYQSGLGAAQYFLGLREMWWGSSDGKAEAILLEAERNYTKLLELDPHHAKGRQRLALTLANLAIVAHRDKRDDDGKDLKRRALALSEGLVKDFPDNVDYQRTYLICMKNIGGLADGVLHKLLEELVERFPEEVDFRFDYGESLMQLAARTYSNGNRAEALNYFDRSSQQFARVRARAPHQEDAATELAKVVKCRMGLAIELGDHQGAAKILQDYPSDLLRYHAELPAPRDPNPERLPLLKLKFYEDQTMHLMTPAVMLQQCALLAAKDERLSPEEATALVSKYRSEGEAYQAEADRAIGDWVDIALNWQPDYVAFHVDSRVEAAENSRKTLEIPKPYRLAQVAADRAMLRHLIRKSVEQLGESNVQTWIAVVLSAAPADFRAPEVALKMAERGVELAPEHDDAKRALAWALFRVGEWERCIEVARAMGSDFDEGPHSILTMALWKAGRRDEARKLMDEAGERMVKLKQKKLDQTARGRQVIPSLPMFERLHREATQMIEPEKKPREEP